MRITITAALFLGCASTAFAYTCNEQCACPWTSYTWLNRECNAADGYVGYCNYQYYEEYDNCNGYVGGCTPYDTSDRPCCYYKPFSKQVATDLNSCCDNCANNPNVDCDSNIWTNGYTPGEVWTGCDGAAPITTVDSAAAQATTQGLWFTTPESLYQFALTSSYCTDACTNDFEQVPFGGSTTGNSLHYVDIVGGSCYNYQVDVYCVDWCGYDSSKSFYVRYDTEAPDVQVTLGEFTDKKDLSKYQGKKWEDIDLEIDIEDNCDLNPYVTITVYSDELGVTKDLDKAAVLTRTYDPEFNGLNGWDLALYRYKTATKTCDNDWLCDDIDGRYYTVEVCALDAAGWWACNWDEVGPVPDKLYKADGSSTKDKSSSSKSSKSSKTPKTYTKKDGTVVVKGTKGSKFDKWSNPENDGWLYVVAEDAAYWASWGHGPYAVFNQGLPDQTVYPTPDLVE